MLVVEMDSAKNTFIACSKNNPKQTSLHNAVYSDNWILDYFDFGIGLKTSLLPDFNLIHCAHVSASYFACVAPIFYSNSLTVR